MGGVSAASAAGWGPSGPLTAVDPEWTWPGWVWVVRAAKALAVASVAAAVLVPLAAFFRSADTDSELSTRSTVPPAVTRPPTSRSPATRPPGTRPPATTPVPSNPVRPVPPTLPEVPGSTTTVVPDPAPAEPGICGIVRDDEASAILGGPVASRTPGRTLGFGRPMAACVVSTAAAGAPGGAQLVFAVGNEIDYLLSQAIEPGATNLRIGTDSYISEHPGSEPPSVGMGVLDGSQCLVFQIIGSTAPGAGIGRATELLLVALARL